MIQLEKPIISSGISKDERYKHVLRLYNYYSDIIYCHKGGAPIARAAGDEQGKR
jgi:hypothetical protein